MFIPLNLKQDIEVRNFCERNKIKNIQFVFILIDFIFDDKDSMEKFQKYLEDYKKTADEIIINNEVKKENNE